MSCDHDKRSAKDKMTDVLVDWTATVATYTDEESATIAMRLKQLFEEQLDEDDTVRSMMRTSGKRALLEADEILAAIGLKNLCGNETAQTFIVTRSYMFYMIDTGPDGDPDHDPGPLPDTKACSHTTD